ncbi:hypothetical protein [Ornithinicoccus hortensis]|uniref:Uncharacterized protein n=1 Tax=Ornithinicoccus hortensis TaxID=82346 RepID=A0A542YRS8_9MICO|nr:hypothetical protein [Ornithinicoccus hortensis]TQL50806.1 hypothetical protein FB467_1924 [Ornithinicoccus hortensis]
MANAKKRKNAPAPTVRTGPSPDDPHDIVYFKRHVKDDPAQAEPGRDALRSWPTSVRAKANAVLIAVATAPPKRFAGGGYWEAMQGEMTGWFEVRIDGPKRHHYRLFCLLDYEAKEKETPLLVVVDGRDKPFRTTLNAADYAAVRSMGEEYLKRNPRSIG